MTVFVYPDPDVLARAAAGRIAATIQAATSDTVTVALAGGSTPRATYAALRHEEVPWRRVYAWVGDERFVPPEDPANNGRMIRQELLEGLEATFFPVPWRSNWSPAEAAHAYEQKLGGVLDRHQDGPVGDLMLLGLGDDGHTLSLFPDSPALQVADRWYVENWVEGKGEWRLTATLPLAHRMRHIIFLVSGATKAEALARVLEPPPDQAPLPARLVMEGGSDVVWLVDRPAASKLSTTEVTVLGRDQPLEAGRSTTISAIFPVGSGCSEAP